MSDIIFLAMTSPALYRLAHFRVVFLTIKPNADAGLRREIYNPAMSHPATSPDHPCYPGCAACCIAPSISGPIPDLHGPGSHSKPAGVPCVQLDAQLRCSLFGDPRRPAVCTSLQPGPEMCGTASDPARNRVHALHFLADLERLTQPDTP